MNGLEIIAMGMGVSAVRTREDGPHCLFSVSGAPWIESTGKIFLKISMLQPCSNQFHQNLYGRTKHQ